MAITRTSPYYDINRDMYFDSEAQYRRHMEHRAMEEERARAEYRRKEEEYRKQQALMQNPSYNPYVDQAKVEQPKPHLKDPLNFLQTTDKKVLLTGEIK